MVHKTTLYTTLQFLIQKGLRTPQKTVRQNLSALVIPVKIPYIVPHFSELNKGKKKIIHYSIIRYWIRTKSVFAFWIYTSRLRNTVRSTPVGKVFLLYLLFSIFQQLLQYSSKTHKKLILFKTKISQKS